MQVSPNQLQKYQIGAGLGFLIGLILFVNRPSILEVILGTLIVTLYGASTGYAIDNPSFRKKWIILIIPLLIVGSLFALIPQGDGCLSYAISNPPSTNPLTGETRHEHYDGFRLKHCDKGRHPWYYQELRGDELKSYCENHSNYTNCQIAEDQDYFR